MSTLNEKPPVEYLWEKYSYNPLTGALHRRDNDRVLRGNHSTRSHQLSIHYRSRHPYAVVIWAFMTGAWPIHEIDHIDRDHYNHRWWNLRELTSRRNKLNTRRARAGAYPDGSRWQARIRHGGKNHYLGSFATQAEAQAAYAAALAELERQAHAL